MNQPLLEVDDVRVSYGQIEAVRGVSLEIYEGEFVGLIGPNGAGNRPLSTRLQGWCPLRRETCGLRACHSRGSPPR